MAQQEKAETSNVIHAFGDPLPGAPIPQIVERLEDMLALAKSGEMRAVAFASVMKSGDIHTGFEREAGQKFALGGAVLQMSYRYAALVNGET